MLPSTVRAPNIVQLTRTVTLRAKYSVCQTYIDSLKKILKKEKQGADDTMTFRNPTAMMMIIIIIMTAMQAVLYALTSLMPVQQAVRKINVF